MNDLNKNEVKRLMKHKMIAVTLMLCFMFSLSGCGETFTGKDSEGVEQPTAEGGWVIKIDQTITAPYMGSLGGQSEIMSENTMRMIATNHNDSPYDGQFTGTAYITSFTDMKKELEDPENIDFLEYKTSHEAHGFTFVLKPTDLAALTQDDKIDERLADVSTAEFLMPTKGENPATVKGSAGGYQFAWGDKLDFSLTCVMQQTKSNIELNTDMFGSFAGTIKRLSEDELDFEIAPLTPSESAKT